MPAIPLPLTRYIPILREHRIKNANVAVLCWKIFQNPVKTDARTSFAVREVSGNGSMSHSPRGSPRLNMKHGSQFSLRINYCCLWPQPTPEAAAVCVHGDYEEALGHLMTRTIYIKNPEEVRGGGLLKYARLLTKGFKV